MTRRTLHIISCMIVGGALLLAAWMMVAAPAPAFGQGDPPPDRNNGYCFVCHAQPDQAYTLPDGTTLDITIDPAALAGSVHGDSNPVRALGCVNCHGDITYPHLDLPPADARSYRVRAAAACATCHTDQAADLADGVHYTALASGDLRAATCVDCHGSHAIQPPDESREHISTTCGTCHQIAFAEYRQSVHGEALFAGDPNVPTCVDCHGVHGIQHPTTALFRNRSPELCATCHADDALMKEYGISTNVFNSYLTDFHGATVQLFEQQDPNVATNKAVCFDCHGVHDIARADDNKSRVVRENLLETCQQCHPDASSNFPASWVGHYEPTTDEYPLLFAVNTFYLILIPGVLGGFALLIGSDIYRRIRQRRQG